MGLWTALFRTPTLPLPQAWASKPVKDRIKNGKPRRPPIAPDKAYTGQPCCNCHMDQNQQPVDARNSAPAIRHPEMIRFPVNSNQMDELRHQLWETLLQTKVSTKVSGFRPAHHPPHSSRRLLFGFWFSRTRLHSFTPASFRIQKARVQISRGFGAGEHTQSARLRRFS